MYSFEIPPFKVFNVAKPYLGGFMCVRSNRTYIQFYYSVHKYDQTKQGSIV